MAAVALNTVADYVTQARVLLQDTISTAYRYSDDEIVSALNLAMIEARRIRADLFLGRAVPTFIGNDITSVVIDDQYRMAFLYYVVGSCQLRDEEDTQDQRAVALLTRFVSQLLQTAA